MLHDKSDWKSDVPWFCYGHRKCMFVDFLIGYKCPPEYVGGASLTISINLALGWRAYPMVQIDIATCLLQTRGNKMHKQTTLVVNLSFLLANFLKSATKNMLKVEH